MISRKPKKVLYLITKSNWGGAQRYVYDLATHLDKSEFEPMVALGGDGELSTLLQHAGIKVIKINSLGRDVSAKKDWLFIKELWQILKTEKPDIFHVNSSKAGAIGTLLGRLARVPRVIFTAHGWAFNEDRPYFQKIIIKGIHWLTVSFSHQTIAVSKAIILQMNWPLVHKKMRVINPGRSIGVMYGKTEARDKLIGIKPELTKYKNHLWIITIAELHPIKRIDVLLRAMKVVREKNNKIINLVIGDGQLKNDLAAQINGLGTSDTSFLLGSVTEAARFLKAADLFVLPSKSESYGYVLHEAGLASVPVLATNVGGIPDVIKDGETGILIEPDNPEMLAEKIIDFVEHKKQWQERSSLHHEEMEQRSIEQMTSATCALYSLPLH